MKSLLRLSLALLSLGSASLADFALRDGDTVAFLGDSITAARHYGKTIETYTLMRFPERKIRFMNVGRGGETAKGGLARIDEILDQGVTVLTVAYGINDIGWGTKADDLHRNEYLDSISAIVDRCKARKVRVFIASAAITAEEPEKAENNFLQRMCDDALKQAQAKGAGTIDVQRTMREVQRRAIAHNNVQKDKSKPTKLHAEDGVHLNDLGQLAMAYAFLKGFDAPADVSSLEIDAANLSAGTTENCRVSDVAAKDGQITFTRTDLGLPLNLHHFWSLQFIYIPMGEELNRYMLTVRNLPEGKYDVTAGGRGLGQWSAGQLSKGLNVSSSTADGWQPGGPWDVQSRAVKMFTDMRDELIAAGKDAATGLREHPDLAAIQRRIAETEKLIIDLQRSMAKPVPVNFVVKPVAEKKVSVYQPGSVQEFAYGEAGGEKQMLDVYFPSAAIAPGAKRPGILLVHGGGWCGGNRKDIANEARALASAGYVAISVGYRLCNGPAREEDPAVPVRNRYPAALDDCQRAVRWVRQHAAEYQLDPDRLAAIGWSAGGHLVSLLGTMDTRDNSDATLARYSSRVTSVVNVFGPSDLSAALPGTNLAGKPVDPKAEAWMLRRPTHWLVDDFLGSTDVAAQRAASPVYHINAKTVPFITVHGELDHLVPIAQSRAFHAALKKAGVSSELLEIADEGHGFNKPENQKRIIEAVRVFLDRTVPLKQS